jgi:hypothetical protein
LRHFQTGRDNGREIDFLLENEAGFIAIECKLTDNATPHEARHFRALADILDKPLLLNLVVSKDPQVKQLTDTTKPTYNISAPQLFS